MNPFVIGWIDFGSYMFMAVGVVIYYRFFRNTSFRRIYLGSQIFLAVVYMMDYVLVKRLNEGWFPNVPFLFVSGAFSEVFERLNAMPFLVLAGQLCPDGMEATFFALMM